MTAIIWTDVLALAPELVPSLVPHDAQQFILSHVNTEMNPDAFGGESAPSLRLARIYMAAHLGTFMRQGASGVAGPVTSMSEGGISVSYANMMSGGSSSNMSATSYGQLYLDLVRNSYARVPFVI